jgi:hypothetical protein
LPLPDRCRVLAALSSDLMTMNPQFFRSSAFAWCFSLPYCIYSLYHSLTLRSASTVQLSIIAHIQVPPKVRQSNAKHTTFLAFRPFTESPVPYLGPTLTTPPSIVVAPGLWLRGSSVPSASKAETPQHNSRYSGWEKHHQARSHGSRGHHLFTLPRYVWMRNIGPNTATFLFFVKRPLQSLHEAC